METEIKNKNFLGINSLGRIGKLSLWNHLVTRHFDGIVINIGRKTGKNIEAMVQALENDSTYGNLSNFLYGQKSRKDVIKVVDSEKFIFDIDGMMVKVLTEERDPAKIPWKEEQVQLVLDCTGKFVDPTVPIDSPKGSLRGHLAGGARKVIVSAPFKIKDAEKQTPADSIMMVYGINHIEYDPQKHDVISAASCTTTGLSHMIKPLMEDRYTSKILTASMSTVHAATNTQSVLDSLPKAGASDLRKTRSVFNNIILSTTGAAKALESIIPEIQEIGFMADSVRIPTTTVSLITLNITFNSGLDEKGNPIINRQHINNIYKTAAAGSQKGLLVFSDRQNVSADLAGYKAAVVIEGSENHTRTGFIKLPAETVKSFGIKNPVDMNIPVTHAKIFGWYDNEFGSYVNLLEKLTVYVDQYLH
ncbi:MAG TPA: glyceraldehyde 3-phosphate dehydrogenase NAD-binding domain-containing protein [Bacteroidales bacterium]|nr:glyceraldehyde 3-phosphate dehydrogenase NAD-binding domain-containing protein [Bacteroidales bacterium]HQI70939.1 glyceraldehyde 3-phosphate dehydrogenase NAD-binding domain-containing protein [Bacteroidales bacterium]